MKLDSRIPEGKLEEKWTNYKARMRLVNPANKRKFDIIVVGSGLAGASAAASLAELGYNVKIFTFHDSPRRAHSIAAQGGINAAKNYKNDGDSVWRLFYDTVKGGDYRSREANVYRLAELSGNIIDQAVAQGVPFAREYGGLLDNRSFGGAQVSRTFYARGQTGQQLLLGAYSALNRQIAAGRVKSFPFYEMLDLVLIDGQARGIVTRHHLTGKIESHSAHAVVLASGGYGNVFYLSTNARGSNGSALWKAYKRGAGFANPSFTQIHPTCIPRSGEHQAKLTLMSESLRNDGRVWVPRQADDLRPAAQIPENERDYILERKYPTFGNLVPRDIAARAIKEACDAGHGVGQSKQAVYLDFAESIGRLGQKTIESRYGNLFAMYEKITGANPYQTPMMIYPAVHYTMGGLWVDYELMTTIPGLFALGEANFSDHGANRLGASALMQGLADGYFILPQTIGNYLAGLGFAAVDQHHPAFAQAQEKARQELLALANANGDKTPDQLHRELGQIMWQYVGMARDRDGLQKALGLLAGLKAEFPARLRVRGAADGYNETLMRAWRLADFIEMGELMARDALQREESCGGHFRLEHQTEEGEARRNDDQFSFVGVWQYRENHAPELFHEELKFEYVRPAQRNYK